MGMVWFEALGGVRVVGWEASVVQLAFGVFSLDA
jgi:hypothetical protein